MTNWLLATLLLALGLMGLGVISFFGVGIIFYLAPIVGLWAGDKIGERRWDRSR